MTEHLTGIEARDRGVTELCAEIAPAGYRVVITHEAVALEDLGARLTDDGPVDGSGTPLWIYGSSLPRDLVQRTTKVQVHEPFDPDETPAWFDHRFPRYVSETTVPGRSCFSSTSLAGAAAALLEEYPGVRFKDPNGASGVGQWSLRSTDEIESVLASVAADARASRDLELNDYLAHFGFVVEAEVEDVEAWSVTVTRTPDGCYSSFGSLRELSVETTDQGVIQNYGGTSIVMVRGDPCELVVLPSGGVVARDPVAEDVRLAPTPGIINAAQRYIEGIRLWEADGAFETRANVDVITGTVARRDGSREEITAALEESGRVGGASPAELLAIRELRKDPDLAYAVRSSRHSFDDAARRYADHARTVAGSHVFWDGIDAGFDGKYVFIGAF
ncbi:DUF3182 family protein [Actinomycetospora flava]|uniref:DUF3182 family protein n=1 Tax=Actinomycetospora flava TaxID=3129232 RepID=A0ABU8MAI9_9PSEU